MNHIEVILHVLKTAVVGESLEKCADGFLCSHRRLAEEG